MSAGATLSEDPGCSERLAAGLPAGTLLEHRYRIEGLLAQGGMGIIHVARDLRLQRNVAVKVLRRRDPDQLALRRFQREALAVGGLSHPNVVVVLDSGTHDGLPFLITELLQGETLREALSTGPLPVDRALRIALQMARGLGCAHAAGIVHRDLKPENVFLTNEGLAKLLDFGIAKDLGGPEGGQQTQPGRPIGTVLYMSPEQVRDQPLDARSDLFTFGVVVHEMLTGRATFGRPTEHDTAHAILCDRAPPLPAVVPSHLRTVVERCLAKNRDARFVSAIELIDTLEQSASHSEPGTGRPAPRAPTRPRPRWLLAALACLGVIGVAAAAGWVRWQTRTAVGGPIKVAVFPFQLHGDQRLDYLREGMSTLLGSELEAKGVRSTETAAIVSLLTSVGAHDPAAVREIAAKLEARFFVTGAIVEAGKTLQLRAVLHSMASDQPVAVAVSRGQPADLFRVVEELAAPMRTKLSGDALGHAPAAGRLARLGRESTSSPEALQAYLEGEATLRKGNWRDAIDLFRRAEAIDPSFVLAQYRLAVAAAVREPGLSDDALSRALLGMDRLAPQDRDRLRAFAAWRRGKTAEAERLYRALLAEHPEDLDGWLHLGETLFHGNPLRGRPAYESSEAFDKVLSFDPDHGAALDHLLYSAVLQRRRGTLAALADRYLDAAADGRGRSLAVRWLRAWGVGDREARETALRELTFPEAPIDQVQTAFLQALWDPETLPDARVLAGAISARSDPRMAARGFQALAAVEMVSGRLGAARAAIARAVQSMPGPLHRQDALFFETLEFVPVDPARLATARAEASALEALTPADAAMRAWLGGMLALKAGKNAEAMRHAEELRQLPNADGTLSIDLSLALLAHEAAQRGDLRAAAAHLDAMRLEIPHRQRSGWAPWAPQHLLRAAVLQDQGNDDAALRWLQSFSVPAAFEPIRLAPATLRVAHLHDRRGDAALAVQHYVRFVELWKDADPELQAEVTLARSRAEALKRDLATAISPSETKQVEAVKTMP